jgi:hypothetical protein
LTGGDPDVILDLQHVFERVYEAGAFARVIDYGRPLTIPLSKADCQWAMELVQN